MPDAPAVSVAPPMNPAPARHPGRWVSALLAAAAVLFILHAFAFSPNIKWDKVGFYLTQGVILRGLGLTIILSIVSQFLGSVLGALLAVMRLSPNPVLSSVSWGYIWFFRGTPLLLQIIFWFNLALIFPHIGAIKTNAVINPLTAAYLHSVLMRGHIWRK